MMTNKLLRSLLQWVVLVVLVIWSFFTFCYLVGEEAPDAHLTLRQFVSIKALALLSACAIVKASVWCYKQGLLPSIIETIKKQCEEEDEA